MDITKQYLNNVSDVFSDNLEVNHEVSYRFFDRALPQNLQGKRVLDVGCGDGTDLFNLAKKGAIVSGIDPSSDFIKKAKKKNPDAILVEGVLETLPFADNSFDLVVSKWVFQTAPDVSKGLREAARVLIDGGELVLLTGHPIRQWIEKIQDYGHGQNYFDQKIVNSHIFDGKITVQEPSHTMQNYFNYEFFRNFELIDYQEFYDFPASEQINGDVYPTFFLIKTRRKNRS